MENTPDNPAVDAPPPPEKIRPPTPPSSWWTGPARWAAELVTVFVGVYAAFMLNNHQSHRHERERRGQIIDWAEKVYSELLTNMDIGAEETRRQGEDFDRRLKAGETPALYAFDFRSDYNPADFTSLLQSGGFDLLEIDTVRALREVEGTLRQLIDVLRHDQGLCDALIRPNLDKDPSFFYDVPARKLRPTYAWYGNYFATQAEFHAQMHAELEKAIAQLRIERARNR